MDRLQLKNYIIAPTLNAIGLGGAAADNLILGTADIETRLQYIKQINGRAVSLWQIEPITYMDLRLRLIHSIKYMALLIEIKKYLNMRALPMSADYLMGNLYAACIFARLKYYFDPAPLPEATDYKAMAAYWKRVYNSVQGAGQIERAEPVFRAAVTGIAYPY